MVHANDCPDLQYIRNSIENIEKVLNRMEGEVKAVKIDEKIVMNSNFLYQQYLTQEAERNQRLSQFSYVNSNMSVIKQMINDLVEK